MPSPDSGVRRTPWTALAFSDDALPGRVALAWTMAGGVVAGGLLIASLRLAGGQSSSGTFSTATILFLMGASAGFVHGSLLGYLGRGTGCPRLACLRRLGVAALLAVPGAALAWLLAMAVALSAVAVVTLQPVLVAGVVLGWIGSLAICFWAAVEGWEALRHAFDRWPEHRAGTVLGVVVLAVLLGTFVREHPTIWGTDVRVTNLGAAILALGATIWIALPVIITGLHVVSRVMHRSPRPTPHT